MKKCPVCKKEVADDATICPHCGHNLVNKEKELPILLKRAQVSYLLDILIMVLPLSLILLMLLNKFLLILAVPLSLLTLVWGFLSIKKKRINNHILKDLIYFNKKDNKLIIYPLDHHEYKINTKLVIKVNKDNLITQRVYITIKEVNEDQLTFHKHKIDLGYASSTSLKEFKSKLKAIIDVDMTVEE